MLLASAAICDLAVADAPFITNLPPPIILDPVRQYSRIVPYLQYGGIVPFARGKMPFVPDLPPVAQNQRQTLFVDFGAFLPTGATLQSISNARPTVNLTVHSYNENTDPNPNIRISAPPYIGTVPNTLGGTGNTNTAILWQVYKCVPGVRYFVEITCGRSDGSDIVEASTYFKCEPLN